MPSGRSEAEVEAVVELLADHYEVDVVLTFGKARRNIGKHKYYKEDGLHVLLFSRYWLERYDRGASWNPRGIQEFLAWQHLGTLSGIQAAWALALHEFAHVLQTRRNGRYHGEMHNECFYNALAELQGLIEAPK